MNPDRWAALERLYHAAVGRDVRERATFLRDACAGDEELRREVEGLLAEPASGDFLATPAIAGAAAVMSTPGASALTGRRIGVYQVQKLLGSGGMGEVYRARDTRLGRDVAFKVLPAELADEPERRSRLLREARAAASLNHPNICTVYEVGEAEGQSFIAMELVAGSSLSARLAEGPLSPDEVLRYGLQLAEAIGHAHDRSMVHGDLKGANIVVTPEGRVKVVDFGLARRLSSAELVDATTASKALLTEPGTLVGTLAYMAPEQLRGKPADSRSDVWALGVVLYEMASGRRPFQGPTAYGLSSAILSEAPPPLPSRVPTQLQAVIRRSLEKERARRYQRGSEVRAALEAVLNGLDAAVDRRPQTAASAAPIAKARQEIRYCTAGDGVRLAYATSGSGPPLVKASNWLTHLDFEWGSPIWRHWYAELSRHHRLVRYDERGNGMSQRDVTNVNFDTWVRDLETVVDAAGLDRFPLLGISRGGPIAIAYAVKHPERVTQLVLYGAYAAGRKHVATPEELEARRALASLLRLGWGLNNPAFCKMFTNRFIPEATPEYEQWTDTLQRVSTSPENAARILEISDDLDVRPLLSQVKTPTLVIHCDRDQVTPPEKGRVLAAQIPGARYVSLPSANHLMLEDEPAWSLFLDELGLFLNW